MTSRRCGVLGMLVLSLALGPAPAEDIADRKTLLEQYRRAEALRQEGKYREAVPIYERLVEAAPAVLGAQSTETATLMNNLGLLYWNLGQYTRAEPLFRRCLQIREAKLGKDHPDVAQSLNNLASLYQVMGQYAKAEPLYRRCLQIQEAKYGKDHPAVAISLNNLAALYQVTGEHARAEPLFQRSLQIYEAKYGKDHPDVATCLNNLAELYRAMGQYARAEPLYQRALRINESAYGKDHPAVATSLNNLAALYQVTGQYARAEPLYQRSLQIYEAKYGKDHPDIATNLNNLAELYRNMGQYARAEPLYQRSLRIDEATYGKNHPAVATSLNNLAALYKDMGQYARAEPFYQRALRIHETRSGKEHPAVATCLNNLALLYETMGQYARAEPLYQRSLEIREEKLGKDHPDVAQSLNNLALLYQRMGQYARAEPLFRSASQIYEAKLGKDHPDVARSLHNLAALYQVMGESARAEPLFQRSLRIFEAKLGKDHPNVTDSLNNLAKLSEASGRTAEAADLTDRARRVSRRHVALVLPALSPPEQAYFLRHNEQGDLHGALSLGLRHAASDTLTARSASWLLNGKAVAHQTAAQSALLARDSNDPQLRDLVRQLGDLRQRLARLTLATPQPKQEQDWQRQLEQLVVQEQDLAKRLSQAGDRSLRPDLWVEVDTLRKSLPADDAFIDIARFDVFDFKASDQRQKWQPARYAAWITSAQRPTCLVDLGPAQAIDDAVRQLRQTLQMSVRDLRQLGELEAETALRQPLDHLAGLVLKPLLPHIGKSRRWLISPDGNLWLVPWAALTLPPHPTLSPSGGEGRVRGKYAIEEHAITYVVSGRDLVHTDVRVAVKPSPPLVLADPDFDLGLDRVALETQRLLSERQGPIETRGMPQALRLGRIPRLPGTAAEAQQIAPRLRTYARQEPRLHTGRQALAGVFQAARNPQVAVLSTHGFFLPDQQIDPKERERPDTDKLRSLTSENPLLRCGLLLAGCNHAEQAKEGQDTGVLTGLQIVGTDLRGCELVVLSACETGLGDVRNGEGVAGLRQAFQLAGAESVAATLWQVPDRQSAQLMIGFFDNLAKGQSKGEALRNAQLEAIQKRRDRNAAAHPFFWAAYTLTGP